MKPILRAFRLVLLGVLGLAAAGSIHAPDPAVHFGLARSAPADKATVHALPEIRLWFTEAPMEGMLTVRLLDAGGRPVPIPAPVSDPSDAKVVSVLIKEPPPAGRYTVSWRGMGADSHTVRGEFTFTLVAHH